MPARPSSLVRLSMAYRLRQGRATETTPWRRSLLWGTGLGVALVIYLGVSAFWKWPHPISSSGGRYFFQRVAVSLPVFRQGDPQWGQELLGPTDETLSQAGCAITSASMVLAGYGVDIDPHRLNDFLTTHDGYTADGSVYWEKAAAFAPLGQVEKVYEDLPSYELMDDNILAGNPVIVRLRLPSGRTHFVVVVGKQGWDYLVQDPAPFFPGVYPLRKLTSQIEALRFYRVVPPRPALELGSQDSTADLP